MDEQPIFFLNIYFKIIPYTPGDLGKFNFRAIIIWLWLHNHKKKKKKKKKKKEKGNSAI